MDSEVVVLKPDELVLKSKGVRKQFAKRLLFNVRDCLKKKDIEFDKIHRGRGRYFIYTPCPEEVILNVKNVFGVSKLHMASQVGCRMDILQQVVLELAEELGVGPRNSFGIRAKNVSTDFPMSSREIESEIGGFIQEKTSAKVDLENPKHWLRIEIIGRKAFIFSKVVQGLGGLPLGTAGRVGVIMSEKKRDLVAAWMVMRRGCEIVPVHFRSSQKKLAQFRKNCKKLEKFGWGSKIKPISIKGSKKELKKRLKKLAEESKCRAYVFGNTEVHPRDSDLPIFEPLVGLGKKKINEFRKLML